MPVYNTASYLNYSIGSILKQDIDFENVELIIINDGSTDGSGAILDDYAAQYSFIKVFHQENKGEAASRNRAIALASGDYIAFVDSDDAIYENTLGGILQYLEDFNLDILYLNISIFDDHCNFLNETPLIGKQGVVLSGLLHQRRTFPATIYCTNLVRHILYPANVMIGPDSIFNFKAQYFAQAVSSYDAPYYKYTQRSNSLSKQGATEKAFKGFVNALHEISNFEQQVTPTNTEEQQYFDNMYHIFITRILELNILPTLDRTKYEELINTLLHIQKQYMLQRQDAKYPYFSKSFAAFKRHQKLLQLKSKAYRLLFNK